MYNNKNENAEQLRNKIGGREGLSVHFFDTNRISELDYGINSAKTPKI